MGREKGHPLIGHRAIFKKFGDKAWTCVKL